ncbi:hypothetical protein [Luteolibacter sp. Populi]|uniref:InlB B-repeat-containing protein n=1 Tax=Luteolibacter sp. Populi TaxID=3230487 RepID=UPI00346521C1
MLAALALFTPGLKAAMLRLDFTGNPVNIAPGWTPVQATHLGDTMVNVPDIAGSGYNFTFGHVATYDNGVPAQPLTRSGFYNFGRLANSHDFVLSGLTPGQSVALYACAAWDGNGAGGYVVYGDNAPAGIQAQTLGNPGTNPTLENFTFIGTAIADETGAVTGSLHGRTGAGMDSEGQVGAFVFLPTQTITASAGENGTISPAGAVGVTAGQNQEFTITANSGFHVADVLVDGVSVGAVGTYTFTAVNADHTISASFAANTTLYTINATAGANGSITPSGAVSANLGVTLPFTITPDPGYEIASVLVDGIPIGAVSAHSFVNVTANHTISASFAQKTYDIEAIVGANGSISPAGTSSVNHGEAFEYFITAAEGYYVAEVLVDGISVGPVESYYFPEVTADHTVEVSFDNRTRLYLDFTTAGSPTAGGWTAVSANYVTNTPLASVGDINGLGHGFSFSNVGSYDNNQTWEPLTRSGFYTFGAAANTHPHVFTVTGMNAGQTVSLYACSTWDGNTAGGYVVFGDSGPAGVKAWTNGTPGANPRLGNLTLIGTAVSDSSGKVSGSLHGRNGVDTTVEGQVGAFVFIMEQGGTPPVNPYPGWASSPPNNLTDDDALPGADPDFNGVSNLLEFALNGSPISGSSAGLSGGKLATLGTETGVMTFTAAVRSDAIFSVDGNRMKASVDGMVYTVEAAGDLGDWGGPVVTEVTGADATAIQAGLPDPEAGWIYKSFRTSGTAAANARRFLRVVVE